MIIQFIARILKLGLVALLIPAAYLGLNHKYVPAPRVTANIAINEKLAFAQAHMPDTLDVLAVGSSMTLNNLNTDAVMEHYGDVAYLNAGAWGTGAAELRILGTLLAGKYRPNTVIVATNIMDFKKEENVLVGDSAAIADALNTRSPWLGYLTHWNAPYYLRQSETNKLRFTDKANYEYLGFDAHGGAMLVVPPDRIDQNRFNLGSPAKAELDETRYAAFANFAKELRALNIDLLVLQSAYRDGLRTAENEPIRIAHVARLQAMLQPLGHRLIDANERRWSDDLYVDGSHFGNEGSKEFTAYCLGQLK